MQARADRLIVAAALTAAVLPLWVSERLPVVDLPQHLHLISVLHRLGDGTTVYPDVFSTRGGLTPYLGYYHLVSWLNWLLPLEVANRVFLSAYVAGMAGGLGYLLHSLGRPLWPALLALPFAYGDSFGWGFINYLSALPLTFLCLGLFIRTLRTGGGTWGPPVALAVCLVAVLLFHVQAFLYLAVALPLLLFLVPSPAPSPAARDASSQGATEVPGRAPGTFRGWLRPRSSALLAVQPAVFLFLTWIVGRLGEPSDIESGAPWKAWGPLLSKENLAFKSFGQNLRELPEVPANLLRDGSDRLAFYGVLAVAAGAIAVGLVTRRKERPKAQAFGSVSWSALVLPCLGAVALALFFLLPFDVRGYIYYVNTRYAHLALPLLVASVPVLSERVARGFLLAAGACALLLAAPLARGFVRFDAESRPLETMVEATAARPRVMGLIFEARSAVVRHPVYLHAGAHLARLRGGLTNFSFALTPHSPLRYSGEPPPTFASEWRPWDFDYSRHGESYDHFLVRGVPPQRVFGPLLEESLSVAAQDGQWTLVRKR